MPILFYDTGSSVLLRAFALASLFSGTLLTHWRMAHSFSAQISSHHSLPPCSGLFPHHNDHYLWLYYLLICCLFTRPWAPWGMDLAWLVYSSSPVPRTVPGEKIGAEWMNKWMNEWVSWTVGSRVVCFRRCETKWLPYHGLYLPPRFLAQISSSPLSLPLSDWLLFIDFLSSPLECKLHEERDLVLI